MSNIISRLLSSMLLVSIGVFSSTVFADRDINKTFIALRDQRNGAAALTTWHTLITNKSDDRLGGNLQVTGFYKGSTNKKELGEALLKGKNFFKVAPTAAVMVGDEEPGNLIVLNQHAANPSVSADKIEINPEHSSYGVRLDYHQQLDGLAEGLWFSVNAPIVCVTNNTKFKTTNESAAVRGLTLTKFFNGEAGDATTHQDALKFAKVNTKDNSKTGVSNVEVALGWNFVESDSNHVGLNAAVVFPTGSKTSGEFMFEPVVGSVHWGVGAGLNADVTMWEDEDQAAKFIATLDYRYMFEETERKTLEFLNPATQKPGFYRYAAVADFTQPAPATQKARPLANEATRDLNITPGSRLDGVMAFAYTNNGFCFDLGYNLFFKEAETGSLKQAWVDNKIGLVNPAYDSNAAANAFGAAVGAQTALLAFNAANIYYEAVRSESMLTHTVFAGLGYTAKDWDYPVLVGVGGSYEFASNSHTAAEGYGVWGKLGVAF